MDVFEQTNMVKLFRDMRWHHDVWVALLGTKIVSRMIEHACTSDVCDRTSLNFVQILIG